MTRRDFFIRAYCLAVGTSATVAAYRKSEWLYVALFASCVLITLVETLAKTTWKKTT